MIADSGDRRTFETGAVRDMQEGKGRMDLVPSLVLSWFMAPEGSNCDDVLANIASFQLTGHTMYLYAALDLFCKKYYFNSKETMILEVAKHFEEGAKKYGENNWQKGLPSSCYIDSALRHLLKHRRGDSDEPHDRAFVWNLLCCIWEVDYHDHDNV